MKKQMKPAVAQSKRTVRNVSEKFYVDICRRVTEAILLTGGDEELAEVAMGVINAYISCGIEPTDDMYVGLRLVFAVLKPELDRAMSRSRKARERARLRRKSDSWRKAPQPLNLHLRHSLLPPDFIVCLSPADTFLFTDRFLFSLPVVPAPFPSRASRT